MENNTNNNTINNQKDNTNNNQKDNTNNNQKDNTNNNQKDNTENKFKTGARFSKLKLVYKKAIQEMLSVSQDETLDSFYNTTIPNINLEHELSELFKRKVREVDLEAKLNILDSLLVEEREVRDLNDELYIKEILESYFVEEKLSLIKELEEEEKEVKELERKLEVIEKEEEELRKEVSNKEKRLNKIIDEHIQSLV